MKADDMVRKITKRHKPGGTLLRFHEEDKVHIKSVFTTVAPDARQGVMSDEHKFFTQSMKLDKIDSFRDYNFWEKKVPIRIVSRYPFKRYGGLKFPKQVEYVTFLKEVKIVEEKEITEKGLRGGTRYRVYSETDKKDNFWSKITQEIGKDDFRILKVGSKSDDNYGFIRYRYIDIDESWDREIKMYQDINSNIKYHPYNDNSDYINDDLKGIVIQFVRKPNLKKRIKVCEY